MADLETKTKLYPTDLTDEEWVWMAPFMPQAAARGYKLRTFARF